jgi:hypothetical protein
MAQANQICGLLAEFGIVIPQGINHFFNFTSPSKITGRKPHLMEDEISGEAH